VYLMKRASCKKSVCVCVCVWFSIHAMRRIGVGRVSVAKTDGHGTRLHADCFDCLEDFVVPFKTRRVEYSHPSWNLQAPYLSGSGTTGTPALVFPIVLRVDSTWSNKSQRGKKEKEKRQKKVN
jgi:hypothetical protein